MDSAIHLILYLDQMLAFCTLAIHLITTLGKNVKNTATFFFLSENVEMETYEWMEIRMHAEI